MNIFLAKKDLQTFPKRHIYTLTNYHELSAQNYNDLLWLLALSIHSQDAPLLSRGLMFFAEYLKPLLQRNDSLIPSLDPKFVHDFLQLANEQESFKNIKNVSVEEKKSASKKLSEKEKTLKNNPDWQKLQDFKAIFDVPLADPTWVIESYLHGGISRLEDIKSRLEPAMKEFFYLHNNKIINDDKKDNDKKDNDKKEGEKKDEKEKKKKQISYKDFCGLKGCKDKKGLEDFLKQYDKQLSEFRGKVQKKEVGQEGAKLLLDGETVTVYRPMTQEGSCYYGQGTKWCTAATKGGNMFNYYNREGPIYILIPKKAQYEKEKYQVSFAASQYMNEKDEEIEMDFLLARFPELNNFLPFLAGNKNIEKVVEKLKKGETGGLKSEGGLEEAFLEAVLKATNRLDTDLMERFLEFEVIPNTESLNFIIPKNNFELVKRFLKIGAIPNVESLNLAASKNDVQLIKLIMEHGVKPTVKSLNSVIRENNLVNLFLISKVKPNVESINLAISHWKPDLAKKFIKFGAKPDAESLRLAIVNGNYDLIEMFLKTVQPDSESLHSAIYVNDANLVKKLLELGAEPHMHSFQKIVNYDNIALLQLLLEYGFIPDTNILNLAIQDDKIEIAKLMVNYGAKPDYVSLMYAKQANYLELAELIKTKLEELETFEE